MRRVHQHAVVGVRLNMLLQVLWTLKGLAAEVALVWLEGNVDADVRGDVIALDSRRSACAPLAGQVEVVGALASDMAFADVILVGVSRVLKGIEYDCRVHRELQRCRIAHRSPATDR